MIEEIQLPHTGDHDYDSLIQKDSSSRCIPMLPCKSCLSISSLIQTLNGHIQAQQTEIERLKHELENVTKKHFTIDDICNNNKLVTVYTGLQNVEVFDWLYERIKDKAKRLMYRTTTKSKIRRRNSRKRKLPPRDEFFFDIGSTTTWFNRVGPCISI